MQAAGIEAAQPAAAIAPLVGRLRIGSIESAAAAHLPALLSAYHSTWPGIALDLAIGTSDALIKAVRRNRLDCAFVAGDEVARPVARDAGVVDEELSYLSVYREELLLLVPPNHPEALRAEDLKITTLAVFPEGCSYRRVLEAWLNTGNPVGKPSWRVMELSSYHTLLACVAAGSCFALCPKSILDRQRSPIDVRTRKIATIDTYLITRSRYRSHAYDALRLALPTTRLAR